MNVQAEVNAAITSERKKQLHPTGRKSTSPNDIAGKASSAHPAGMLTGPPSARRKPVKNDTQPKPDGKGKSKRPVTILLSGDEEDIVGDLVRPSVRRIAQCLDDEM